MLGRIEKRKKCDDEEIMEWSEQQKKLRDDIEASRNKQDRANMKTKRNEILSKIHHKLQRIEEQRIIEKVEEIEKHKDDSNRMYQVVRQLQTKDNNKIIVNAENGVTASEKKQVKIVTDYFRSVFSKDSESEIENVKPVEMRKPFESAEIERAIKKLKNDKSPGVDEIRAEMLKHSPKIIHRRIAEIFNDMAKTGEVPEEIILGILVPLPKPGKPRGPPSNLRPIVLLTILRKILAICMIRRTEVKIRRKIPITQAAYQGGRSTTEHVHTCKLLAEKAITSQNYETTILLLDMSKAFDTVRRNDLLQQLKEVLDEDEVHIMKILLKDVRLVVKMGRHMGEEILTNIGVPQGDCCSPILFTLYLANALRQESIHQDHTYSKPYIPAEDHLPKELKDHAYSIPKEPPKEDYLLIDLQYADDTSWAGVNATQKINEVKEVIPDKLKRSNLMVNNGKTEEYKISSNGDPAWKKCKCLGSLLDSEEDIKRRKGLAIDTYNKLKYIIENKKTSRRTKKRVFKAYVESVMLYNSELWTLTNKMGESLDIFQRKLIRRSLNISWEDKITNEDLYKKIGLTEYSIIVKTRRLRWFGHMSRLPEEAPVRIAYEEATRPVKKLRGGQRLTWPKLIEKDLNPKTQDTKITLHQAQIMAQSRQGWSTHTSRLMSTSIDARGD